MSPVRRLGIIGLGVIAPYFLRGVAASPHWRLTAVCDRVQARLSPWTGREVAVFRNAHELIGSGLVDAVVVTLPNDAHGPVVRAALDAGQHVCCEKPLTIRASEARELAALARSLGLVLFTASHRRHNVHLGRLARELPATDLIARVESRYLERIEEHAGCDDWYLDPGRCGGGCLIDNGPNAIDVARVLLGDLSAVGCTLRDLRGGVEFGARVDLAAGPVPVTVLLDWAYPHGQVKDVTVHLTDGRRLRADLLAGFPGLKGSLDHEYRAVLARFHELVVRREHGSDDGVAVVELIEQAYQLGRGGIVR